MHGAICCHGNMQTVIMQYFPQETWPHPQKRRDTVWAQRLQTVHYSSRVGQHVTAGVRWSRWLRILVPRVAVGAGEPASSCAPPASPWFPAQTNKKKFDGIKIVFSLVLSWLGVKNKTGKLQFSTIQEPFGFKATHIRHRKTFEKLIILIQMRSDMVMCATINKPKKKVSTWTRGMARWFFKASRQSDMTMDLLWADSLTEQTN